MYWSLEILNMISKTIHMKRSSLLARSNKIFRSPETRTCDMSKKSFKLDQIEFNKFNTKNNTTQIAKIAIQLKKHWKSCHFPLKCWRSCEIWLDWLFNHHLPQKIIRFYFWLSIVLKYLLVGWCLVSLICNGLVKLCNFAL